MIYIEVKFSKSSDKDLIEMLKNEGHTPSDMDLLTTSFLFEHETDVKMQRGEYFTFYRFTAVIDVVSMCMEVEEEPSIHYDCHAVNMIL